VSERVETDGQPALTDVRDARKKNGQPIQLVMKDTTLTAVMNEGHEVHDSHERHKKHERPDGTDGQV